jgi:uncharacterized iron-regulated membrane protein
MSTTKKITGQVHLWLGLASGLVVLIVTLTGSLLVFEKELEEWVENDFYFVQPNAQRLTTDSLLKSVQQYDRSIAVTSFRLYTDKPKRSVVFVGKKKDKTTWIAVNPYTAEVIGTRNPENRFFGVVLRMHRYLCLGKTGKAITGVSCLIFLTLIITGLVLWWPKKRKQWQQRMKIKWNATRKRVNWDLHAVGGFYVHLVIFAIALTGLTWAYQWFNNGIYLVFDGKPQVKFNVPANTVRTIAAADFYEKLYADINTRLPYRGEINITIPAKDSLSITVAKTNYEASITNVVDFLYYEKGTGRLLKDRLYKNETMGSKARRIVYPIHTGNIYGWPTKLLALISCIVAFSLPITGLRVWLGKKKKNKRPQGVKARQQVQREPTLAEV